MTGKLLFNQHCLPIISHEATWCSTKSVEEIHQGAPFLSFMCLPSEASISVGLIGQPALPKASDWQDRSAVSSQRKETLAQRAPSLTLPTAHRARGELGNPGIGVFLIWSEVTEGDGWAGDSPIFLPVFPVDLEAKETQKEETPTVSKQGRERPLRKIGTGKNRRCWEEKRTVG